jgi:AraC-like DNA-binding protein
MPRLGTTKAGSFLEAFGPRRGGITVDVISEILTTLQVESVRIAAFDLRNPWAITLPTEPPLATLHAIVSGSCWLLRPGEQPLQLRSGDCVLQLQSSEQTLAWRPDARGTPIAEVFAANGCKMWQPESKHSFNPMRVVHGGDGAESTIVLGAVYEFIDKRHNPLIASLPSLIHVGGDSGILSMLQPMIEFIRSEASSRRAGYMAIARQLSTLVFIHALRTYLLKCSAETAQWLRSLEDVRIVRTLNRIHHSPQQSWTLLQLAKEAGMSRSAFAAKFKELLGRAPIDYLIDWRMHLAAGRIASTPTASISDIATQVGYVSDRAFSKAFKKFVGIPPAAYRRSRAQAS